LKGLRINRFGPGLLVTAAFVGPGTVTTASLAGANYGFALVWALIFSILTTILLQNMAARLGIVSKSGIAEAIRHSISNPVARYAAIALIISAIGIGNAAYQGGNILGAAVAGAIVLDVSTTTLSLVIALFAFALLMTGRYQLIEKCLITLVLTMSVVFVASIIVYPPDIKAMLEGFIPSDLSESSSLMAIALIGTTVVPYNLFLHAKSAQQKWSDLNTDQALHEAKWDTGLSIGLGGLVTLAIMSTAMSAFFNTQAEINTATIGIQLEPLLGAKAKYFFAGGLMAAGLTSAITAPLAAAYAVTGALGWSGDLNSTRFRLCWLFVLVAGTLVAYSETKPLTAILFAQAANGLILPFIAISLLWVMNSEKIMGRYRNRPIENVLAVIAVTVTLALGGYKLYSLMN
jgi:manganese transport protein